MASEVSSADSKLSIPLPTLLRTLASLPSLADMHILIDGERRLTFVKTPLPPMREEVTPIAPTQLDARTVSPDKPSTSEPADAVAEHIDPMDPEAKIGKILRDFSPKIASLVERRKPRPTGENLDRKLLDDWTREDSRIKQALSSHIASIVDLLDGLDQETQRGMLSLRFHDDITLAMLAISDAKKEVSLKVLDIIEKFDVYDRTEAFVMQRTSGPSLPSYIASDDVPYEVATKILDIIGGLDEMWKVRILMSTMKYAGADWPLSIFLARHAKPEIVEKLLNIINELSRDQRLRVLTLPMEHHKGKLTVPMALIGSKVIPNFLSMMSKFDRADIRKILLMEHGSSKLTLPIALAADGNSSSLSILISIISALEKNDQAEILSSCNDRGLTFPMAVANFSTEATNFISILNIIKSLPDFYKKEILVQRSDGDLTLRMIMSRNRVLADKATALLLDIIGNLPEFFKLEMF